MTRNSTRTTPFVGQTAELSRTVDDNDIALFTKISGDRNPLHYDEAAAKASRFGEIVVQGGVTSAILNAGAEPFAELGQCGASAVQFGRHRRVAIGKSLVPHLDTMFMQDLDDAALAEVRVLPQLSG